MREILNLSNNGDIQANLALDMFCYRIKKYIGSYLAILGKVDAIIFTGGIGENAPIIREKICNNLEHLNICLDLERNLITNNGAISTYDSEIEVLVIPTNEELEIALQTKELLIKNSVE
jgi:acetate kinase